MTSLSYDALLSLADKELLVAYGVDNWEGYDEAMSRYIGEDDPVLDAEAFVSALLIAGVDNWDGYSDVTRDAAGYVEYLEGLEDMSQAVSAREWADERERTAREAAEAPGVVAEGVDLARPCDQVLYGFIEGKFGKDAAPGVFAAVMRDGRLYNVSTFRIEFKEAMKSLVAEPKKLASIEVGERPSANATMEKARVLLLDRLIANGKLEKFLDEYAPVSGK